MTQFSLIPQTKDLVKIRKKIEGPTTGWEKFTESDKALMNSAFNEITGQNPPSNCSGCGIVFTILRNWLRIYDNQPQAPQIRTMEPVKDLTEKEKAEIKKSFKDTGKVIITNIGHKHISITDDDIINIDEMTVRELKTFLTKRGIEYPKKANKTALRKLAK